jgi:hypothetical protein
MKLEPSQLQRPTRSRADILRRLKFIAAVPVLDKQFSRFERAPAYMPYSIKANS